MIDFNQISLATIWNPVQNTVLDAAQQSCFGTDQHLSRYLMSEILNSAAAGSVFNRKHLPLTQPGTFQELRTKAQADGQGFSHRGLDYRILKVVAIPARPRLSAVSYLNTRPLVWGLLHGPQSGRAELSFDIPAVCADLLQSQQADAGLVPVIEAQRQHLEPISDLCIACRGPVRSILLLSKKPVREIRSLALDSSSRSSVMLARILLEQVYHLEPELKTMVPDLSAMLGAADAALIIGDPALRIDPASTGLHVLDLGEEWFRHTGLPMVFAMWSGPQPNPELAALLEGSYDYGRQRIPEIVAAEAAPRHLDAALAEHYLLHNIVYRLDDDARRGMRLYLETASKMEAAVAV